MRHTVKEKVASRFLLPLEMLYLGPVSIITGLSGSFGAGALHRQLSLLGQEFWWGVIFILPGLLLTAVSAWEWKRGRCWPDEKVFRSVGARATITFLHVLVWLAAFGILLEHGAWREVLTIFLICPMAAIAAFWCFKENLKVRYVLDKKIPTSGLQFHR